jgi:hypothetical protein
MRILPHATLRAGTSGVPVGHTLQSAKSAPPPPLLTIVFFFYLFR